MDLQWPTEPGVMMTPVSYSSWHCVVCVSVVGVLLCVCWRGRCAPTVSCSFRWNGKIESVCTRDLLESQRNDSLRQLLLSQSPIDHLETREYTHIHTNTQTTTHSQNIEITISVIYVFA